MRLLTITILLCLAFFAQGQQIDYNQIIPSSDSLDLPLQERLVQIAWQNYPKNKILQHKLKQAYEQAELARNSWKEAFNFNSQFNVGSNPDTLNSPIGRGNSSNANTGFGVGISMNLGAIFNNKIRTKVAMEDIKVAEETLNMQKLAVRSQVLQRYQVYLSTITVLRLRTQSAEEAFGAYILAKEQFMNGEIPLPEYNQAFLLQTNTTEAKAEYESKVLLSKIALEEIIGVPLESMQ